MKCIPVFLLSVAAALAADFTTGQAARAVIGQDTFTTQSDQPSGTVLGGVSGLAYDRATDTLFVADSNRVASAPLNHRVLLFSNISASLPTPTADVPQISKCPICVGQASLVLGQPDFTTTTESVAATNSGLRLPTAVASDGVHLIVADTNHNRVLIWNSIPTVNDQAADVVVGQPDFTSASIPGNVPNSKSMRGPQGVWIQNGKLYVADTQNHRVLIYNHIPTSNGVAADVVLGQKDFNTYVEPDLTQQKVDAQATNLLNPVSVTSDGVRLYVTDLGYNRVLIWNSIPSSNDAPADVVVGQPNMTSSIPNNSFSADSNGVESKVLCDSNGTDSSGNPTFPPHCNSTLSFPRFALSDGHRLFIADGGNDRVLIYEQIPTQNAVAAEVVIGQIGGDVNQASDAADSLRSPMSLAWDGTNLYVSDAYNRRITVYSIGENTIPYTGVRNAASLQILAVGGIGFTGTITADDLMTVLIGNAATNAATCTAPTLTDTGSQSTNCGMAYAYKIKTDDTIEGVITALTNEINAGSGDPNVIALADLPADLLELTAKQEGDAGNNVTYSATPSTNATIVPATAGANLTGGADAAKVGPGTLVSVRGTNLAFTEAMADLTQNPLPTRLGNTQVFFDGIAAPLTYVSSTQINAQIPWEVLDTSSINAYVRSVNQTGDIVVTTPVAVTIVTQNPGIFAQGGDVNPPPGVVLHGSSQATGVILVDGNITANDVADVKIEDREYKYTVVTGDTLDTVAVALAELINQDPKVSASTNRAFARNVVIKARIPGPEGNNIAYSSTTTNGSGSATLILTPTTTTLCCANVAGTPVTNDNPAIPGEILLVYATGLGIPVLDNDVHDLLVTGSQYPQGAPVTLPVNFVSSQAGGKTANVLKASLKPGTVGVYEVVLQLNSDMPSDPLTQLYIAQDIYRSNIVTFPLVSPTPFVPAQ